MFKLNISFPELTNLLQIIGAKEVPWSPTVQKMPDGKFEIEVSANKNPEITQYIFGHPKKLLFLDGRQLLLYIPIGSTGDDPTSLPRFHFMECRTISEMRSKGRFERYLVTNKTSGYFTMKIGDSWYSSERETKDVRLYVCKHCLKEYNYLNYKKATPNEKSHIVELFDINAFFSECKYVFSYLPRRYDTNILDDEYPKNWNEIATAYKNTVNWRCEVCSIDLSSMQRLLHVHHRNGVKSDTASKNLQAICKLCHSEQYKHQHMPITEQERKLILLLRKKVEDSLLKFKGL